MAALTEYATPIGPGFFLADFQGEKSMTELLGAALDAAVARAVGLTHEVQPLRHLPSPDAPREACFVNRGTGWFLFQPSKYAEAAMGLQVEHDVAVYPDPDAAAVGTERWIAGFNLSAGHEDDDYSCYGPALLLLDHAARGTTPAIAICRALVTRMEDHVKAAELAMAERAAAVENARLRVIFDRAHNRVWTLLTERQPTLVFESDEDQEAYSALVEIARDRAAIRTAPEWMKPFLQVSREIGWSAPMLTIGPVGKLAIKAEPS